MRVDSGDQRLLSWLGPLAGTFVATVFEFRPEFVQLNIHRDAQSLMVQRAKLAALFHTVPCVFGSEPTGAGSCVTR